MAWIEIEEGIWAKESENDPEEILIFDEVKNQLEKIEEEISSLESALIDTSKITDERVKHACELWNKQYVLDPMYGKIAEKYQLIEELKELGVEL